MLTPSDLPNLDDNVSALYFGGISLACEPGAEAYAALLEKECHDRIVMIDPNIRPIFIKDETRYRARLERMISNADIVKLSDEDLDWLQAGSKSQSAKAKLLLEQGPSFVILTRGSAGATAFLGTGEEVNVAAQSVDVVDTVGAGDTFNAGVLCKLAELGLLNKTSLARISSKNVKDALEFGAKVAAVTVSRAGADPPRKEEI
jgi:fructokinase